MGAHASWLGWPPLVLAQITPDTTLGAESSVVTPDAIVGGDPADLIEGGALRGSNVFHSFIDFNVAESQRVYFANPDGINNIVSRVTGGNVSNIFGTLGVDGAANLFLLNPNGILFGPNAQLDVAGSFSASTGDRFSYLDGSEFSAITPNAAPLVTVSITPGVQFGADAPDALILNQGDLVAGQDLTLQAGAVNSSGTLTANNGQVWVEAVAGDASVQTIAAEAATVVASHNVMLDESRLITHGDLLIQADNTVRVRDSADNPVQVWADGDLTLQGNRGIDILALNHPETPFQSTGNLSLVSDGAVSGDAHFASGGGFSILDLAGNPGTFISLYDPIISAQTDVVFGNYIGTSLLVESTGSITAGDITINGPDTLIPISCGTDCVLLHTTPAVILRSGLATLAYAPSDPADAATYTPNSAYIDGGGVVSSVNGGAVQADLSGLSHGATGLNFQQQTPAPATPGITVGTITIDDTVANQGLVGHIILEAIQGNITLRGSINPVSYLPTRVEINAISGDVYIESSSIITNSADLNIRGHEILISDSTIDVTLSSNSQPIGGSVYITVNQNLNLSNSTISTATVVNPSSNGVLGSNINIVSTSGRSILFLNNDSEILATGHLTGGPPVPGGNISIQGFGFITSQSGNNNNILTNGVASVGGVVGGTIDTGYAVIDPRRFTIFSLDTMSDNLFTTLTAAGSGNNIATSGVLSFLDLGLLNTQQLPEISFVDASRLVGYSCEPASSTSYLIFTGRGGVPQNPMFWLHPLPYGSEWVFLEELPRPELSYLPEATETTSRPSSQPVGQCYRLFTR
jgi:filamentous hemagglutinin family protein